MERRAVGKFRRAAEPCQSASCPALIALIDRRGKQNLLCYGLGVHQACVHVTGTAVITSLLRSKCTIIAYGPGARTG
jgi:hypothetical protein